MSTVAIAPWCADRHHDINEASDRELITGTLWCGCWVEGPAAARMLRARRLAESRGPEQQISKALETARSFDEGLKFIGGAYKSFKIDETLDMLRRLGEAP